MMQKISKFGGAMLAPVLLFAWSGIVIGICSVMKSTVIMGDMAAAGTTWYKFWSVIDNAGYVLFTQVNLLFVIGLPIGLAKKQNARACLESFALYVTLLSAMAALLNGWGDLVGIDYTGAAGSGTGMATVAGIKTLDIGMIGALIMAGITVSLHDRFFDKKLPDWLGVFQGSPFVVITGFPIVLVLAVAFFFVWPHVQHAILSLQTIIIGSGAVGVWIFTFLERFLIPTGLHHFIYMPFLYDNVVIDGGIKAAWVAALPTVAQSRESLQTLFPAGAYSLYGMSKIFAPLGISAAFYTTAKPSKKKEVLGLMMPVTLTALICGVTEPIEFTFLFAAPLLFLVHAVLAGFLAVAQYSIGMSGCFISGLLDSAVMNWIPCGVTHWQQYLLSFGIGLIFTVLWFVSFRFLILKFNFKTPGREDDDAEVRLVSKAEYNAAKKGAKDDASQDPTDSIAVDGGDAAKAKAFLEALGGKDNIESVTNCATRLRVTVRDESLVKDQNVFKKAGAHGLVNYGKSIQVIVGLSVQYVREEFEKLL